MAELNLDDKANVGPEMLGEVTRHCKEHGGATLLPFLKAKAEEAEPEE